MLHLILSLSLSLSLSLCLFTSSPHLSPSQEVLTSELLYRLAEDISTLKKGKERTSSKALSVTEELLRLLEWMQSQQSLVREEVSVEVEKVRQVSESDGRRGLRVEAEYKGGRDGRGGEGGE